MIRRTFGGTDALLARQSLAWGSSRSTLCISRLCQRVFWRRGHPCYWRLAWFLWRAGPGATRVDLEEHSSRMENLAPGSLNGVCGFAFGRGISIALFSWYLGVGEGAVGNLAQCLNRFAGCGGNGKMISQRFLALLCNGLHDWVTERRSCKSVLWS